MFSTSTNIPSHFPTNLAADTVRPVPPALKEAQEGRSAFWANPSYLPFEKTAALCSLVVSDQDIKEGEERLQRFAPLIAKLFPETQEAGGLIESPLLYCDPQAGNTLSDNALSDDPFWVKLDANLPIAGSVKARGGIYEVLKHAEEVARAGGFLTEEDVKEGGEAYLELTRPEVREYLQQHVIQVGSTGNLGLAIGIMGAALGFQVRVHMSVEAAAWKKALLRERGAEVVEYAGDYTKAVAQGRAESANNPRSYFVDDEKSKDLFVGYAVAASRLLTQLDQAGVLVDPAHPLFVFLPAGVGGAPGGITYGLKRIYKDAVHCFFVEPVTCPSLLAGMASGLYEDADVHAWGLSGQTIADGLACPRPSGLVTRLLSPLLTGIFTVTDAELTAILQAWLARKEAPYLEPSAVAGFAGLAYFNQHPEAQPLWTQGTKLVWTTGGSLVPTELRWKRGREEIGLG